MESDLTYTFPSEDGRDKAGKVDSYEPYSYEQEGYAAGKAASSWVTDGNTTAAEYRAILAGIESGDPEIMDIQPSPLSGEWAGESIPELIRGYSDMTPEQQESACDSYEQGFSSGFWEQLENDCRVQVDLTVPPLDRDGRYRVEGWPAVAVYVVDQYSDRAIVVMVGDDTEHDVDATELVPIDEDDYCAGCGQIGCGH